MVTQLHDTGEEYYQGKLDGESFDILLFHDGNVSGYVDKPIQNVDTGINAVEVDTDIRNFLSAGDVMNIVNSTSNNSPTSKSDNYNVVAVSYDFETERTVIEIDSNDVTLQDDTPYGDARFGIIPGSEDWVRGDNLFDNDDIGDISTEPSDGNYSRQTGSFSKNDVNGDWRLETDSDTVFDMTDTTGRIDAGAVIVNYQSSDTGDGSANDHILFTFSLEQDYLLENTDQLTINAGTINNSIT